MIGPGDGPAIDGAGRRRRLAGSAPTNLVPGPVIDLRDPEQVEETAGRVLRAPGDNNIRWAPGERLEHLIVERCMAMEAAGRGDHPAVDWGDGRISYRDLHREANRLARSLLAHGVRPGWRVGLLLDRSARTYLAMLAVLQAGAAYVPLDPAFPRERIDFILGDAGVGAVLAVAETRGLLDGAPVPVIVLDDLEGDVATHSDRPLAPEERGDAPSDLCYVIYTSGSTGRPKGVAVEHPSICNFVRVAAECYRLSSDDRVYQGMTVAFDFSVEEIWVPMMSGATLVPNTTGAALAGEDLHRFLDEREVTALCCVPTLLATLHADLPRLRWLLVSGEACPPELAERWHRSGRVILNVYGPTEATVTATWLRLRPGAPVTIGRPLPTYSVVILDENEPRALSPGEVGEIGIAGIGLALGYLNRPDLTEAAFVPDFLGVDGNPSGRIYRTGDRGRIGRLGEVEYLGRIDTQVKVRGYRIEPAEIETELLRMPGIAQAAVTTHPVAGAQELVAYYTTRGDVGVDPGAVLRLLRDRLPAYMVPAFLEELPDLPRLPSDKVDRSRLPPPRGRRPAPEAGTFVAPTTPAEERAADLLAEILGMERVSVGAHLFDELGADSLSMARFCARLRTELGTEGPSMRDVYFRPTVRDLVADLEAPPREPPSRRGPAVAEERVGSVGYWVCGLMQATALLAGAGWVAWLGFAGYEWMTSAAGPWDAYLRAVALAAVVTVVLSVAPIALKWALVGRWRATAFPIWGLTYFRFWLARNVTRASPMVAFAGTPLFNLYLRLLGADIGRGAVIQSRIVPGCPDLISIGEGAVVKKEARLLGFVARAGMILTGPVTVGAGAHVGDGTVLDIDTSLGDGARLAHASSLHRGQAIPSGTAWLGSPAEPADIAGVGIPPPLPGSRARAAVYTVAQVSNVVGIAGPIGILYIAVAFWIDISRPLPALAFFFGSVVTSLLTVVTLPRVVGRLIPPGRVYPLYGVRHGAQRAVSALTNSRFHNMLFGDSSYILHYLRAIGMRISTAGQTGSNFGAVQKWDSPYHSRVGDGTLVSDGLSIVNLELSATSFRVAEVAIGGDSFLGNNVIHPAGATTGDDCLLATKVAVPVTGPPREHIGLLGSPAFEIPRTVQRDAGFERHRTGAARARGLRRKNRSNLATMAWFLGARWLLFYVGVTVAVEATTWGPEPSRVGLAAGLGGAVVWAMAELTALEWATLGFSRLTPRTCSIYQRPYWRHERYWKLADPGLVNLFDGTPFKAAMWRMLGARVGRRLYDGGCFLTERSLVELGDDCTLDEGTLLQSHSLEDGVFKSGHIRLGNGCTVGTAGYVHYGVEMGDACVLEPDSFLMKGETPSAGEVWAGNPARRIAG